MWKWDLIVGCTLPLGASSGLILAGGSSFLNLNLYNPRSSVVELLLSAVNSS
jgi:hypothetical protein